MEEEAARERAVPLAGAALVLGFHEGHGGQARPEAAGEEPGYGHRRNEPPQPHAAPPRRLPGTVVSRRSAVEAKLPALGPRPECHSREGSGTWSGHGHTVAVRSRGSHGKHLD